MRETQRNDCDADPCQTRMPSYRVIALLCLVFLVGFLVGQFACKCSTSNSSQTTCAERCVDAVSLVQNLWPSSTAGLTLLRIVPKTQEACANICLAKAIKDVVL